MAQNHTPLTSDVGDRQPCRTHYLVVPPSNNGLVQAGHLMQGSHVDAVAHVQMSSMPRSATKTNSMGKIRRQSVDEEWLLMQSEGRKVRGGEGKGRRAARQGTMTTSSHSNMDTSRAQGREPQDIRNQPYSARSLQPMGDTQRSTA